MYDEHTGRFKGETRLRSGYLAVKYLGKATLVHRAAWHTVHGVWPNGQIDHINGDKSDNRIPNLRDVSNQVNQMNRHTASNKLGIIGVYERKHRHCTTYQAKIKRDGKSINLGSYPTIAEARNAYLIAKALVHPEAAPDH